MSRQELRGQVRQALPWSFTAGALQIVLSLVSMVLLVRYLEPAEYGVWAMFNALPLTVNLISSFGWSEFIIRFVPGLGTADEVGRAVWPIVFRQTLLAVAISTLLVLGFDLYAHRFGLEGYGLHIMVTQWAVVANRGTAYLTTAMNARFMQREVVLRTFPAQALQLGLTAVGIALREDFLFFVIVASGVAVANLVAAAWVFGRRYPIPGFLELVAGVQEDREQTSYRRISFVNEWGINFLSTDIARFIVSYFSNNVEVAIYAVATTIVSRLQFFLPIQMLRSVTGTTFYTRYEQTRDPADLQRMFRFLYDVNNLVSLALVVAFLAGGREMLALMFQSTYADAYAPVVVLLGFLIMNFMPLGMVVRALKRPESLLYSKLAVLLNVGIGIPLVIHYGATGMAVATAVSVAFKNAIMLYFVRRLVPFPMPWRALTRSCAAAAIAVVAARAVAPWGSVLAALAVGGIVYALGIRVLQPLEPADRLLLDQVAPGPLARLVPWVLGRPTASAGVQGSA